MRWAARAYCLLTTKHYSLLTAFFLLAIHHSLATLPAQAQDSTPNSVITTVAGNGRVFRGDGGLATQSQLGVVQGVTVDSAGNVYATDETNDIVVKISPAGIIRVVAGNNIAGFSGDGGPATNASLNLQFANGVAVDSTGNVYIADQANNRVRKVNSDGIITTFAGNGLCCFSEGGLAVSTPICGPQPLAVDGVGNVYIGVCQRVLKVTPGGIISLVAGTGSSGSSGDGGLAVNATLANPTGLAVDSVGNIFVADYTSHRVRKIATDGTISTIVGNGVATSSGDGGLASNATVNGPAGLALDVVGNLYVAEADGRRIRRISPNGITSTIASGFRAVHVAVFSGNVYFADYDGHVRRVNSAGAVTSIAGAGLTNFSGDGGPAINAALSFPRYLAVDAAGNLYISDQGNSRVRKVTLDGTITTIAGNGNSGFSGNNGPATRASLSPGGIAVDSLGNLYLSTASGLARINSAGIITTIAGGGSANPGDGGPATNASVCPGGVALDQTGNVYFTDGCFYRVRKVSPVGIITTVAGNGVQGNSGDGGPATSAMLNAPSDVAVDAVGNVYIADWREGRIRKVDSNGIITTFAGGGPTCCRDGIPATEASLRGTNNVFVDRGGNVYIAESSARNRLLRVDPGGLITTVVGSGTHGFSGDGGPATSAQLNFPTGMGADQQGNIYFSDTFNHRIRKVLGTPPSFAFAPASLSFRAPAGSGQILQQRLTITSSVTGLAWAADIATASGGNWLSVSPSSGSLPSLVDVTVNVANLAPGTYRGTMTVVSPQAAVPIQPVEVNLTVEAPLPPKLALEPGSLTFETLVGAVPPGRTLRITNAGGGSLDWTARVETNVGGNWLSVTPASGSASASASNQVQITASSSTLASGVYSGTVIVASSTTNETLRVPVNLLILQSRQTMLLSQSGLLFTGVEGGGVIPAQTFGVLNTGEGVMNWTAQASTLAGGNWLTVSPHEGATDAASLQVPLVDIGVNVAGLAAAAYSGQVRVTAPTASNSPQFVTVILNVLPRGSNPGVLVRPTGLIFAAQAGTSSPSSQTVNLSTITPGSVDIVSGLLTTDGGDWIEALPRNLTLSAGDASQRIVVQPSLGSFAPGVYRGALTLLPRDGSPPQVVSVLFLVVRQTGSSPARSALSGLLEPQTHTACVPAQLFATHRTLGTSFASPVGWPSTIEAQVADDCGHAVPNATVAARFSNGDPQVVLTSLRNGIYVGTWSPATPAAQVVVTVRAELPPLAPAEATAQGSAAANATAPAVFAGGIVNTASYGSGEGLAPGSIVSVFGRNFARGENRATQLPLETSLGGARLNVGGVDVPLFFAGEGQINAQLPFDLPPNTRQVVVLRTARENGGQTYAVPETITITSARPAIFSVNQEGAGQGAILNQNSSLNSASNPAARGSVIQVFATGLGATNPVVSSGQPAPGNPPALVTTAVEARIGGQPAGVQFAGLAPGFVGLYQVNVVVPASIQPGLEVELTLTQNGVPSKTVTVAIQ